MTDFSAQERKTVPIEDYKFLSVAEATAPARGGFFEHYVDAWWLVHPERGLAFYSPVTRTGRRRRGLGSPQCNTDERVTRMVGAKSAPWPDPEVRQIPSAWVPVDLSGYR